MRDPFRTIPEHRHLHVTNLQGRWKSRGVAQDLAHPLGLIVDPQIRGEMDENAIPPRTDFSNRRIHGNRAITIFAIDKTSKLNAGFVNLCFLRARTYLVLKFRYPPQGWDRYLPQRDTRDYEPPVSRSHYSPPSGDRYRPMTDPYDPRDLFPHSRADSYRPTYDTDWTNTPPHRATRARSPAFAGRPPPPDDRHYSPAGMPPSSTHYRPHRIRHNRNMPQRISATDMRRSPSKNDLSPTGSRYLPDSRSTPDSARSRHLSANASSVGRKRSTSPPRKDDESPFKKLRSLSPDRSSSLASSRRSSPAPVILKDPQTSTPPDDHRSTRASAERVDHDTGMVIRYFVLITQ